MNFALMQYKTQDQVREHIQMCEGKHLQQVAYSSFHDALTQLCFGCQKIRTNVGMHQTAKPEPWVSRKSQR